MKKNFVLFFKIISFVLLFSCSKKPSNLDKALEHSGNNKIELERVINHYKKTKDTLKIKAAEYLISNMLYKQSKSYRYVDKYGQNKILDYKKHTTDELNDLINKEGGSFRITSTREDVKSITAKYLITNIDLAFKVREEYPWCKQLSFDEFCNQILPYRLVDEPLGNWRSYYYTKHKEELDSLKKVNTSLSDIIFWFNKKYKKEYISSTSIVPGNFSYKTFEEIGGGNCADLAQNAVKVMRACGIPLHMDIVTYHGKVNGNHVYNSIDLPNGDFYFFSPYERAPERRDWRAHKIMRNTYKIQEKEIYKYLNSKEIPLDELFVNPFYKDVTSYYFPTANIDIIPNEGTSSEDLLYLCTYNKGFHAISWSAMNNKKFHFKDVTKELLYFPMIYTNGQYEAMSDPFILRESGERQILTPVINEKITLKGVKVLQIKKNITDLSKEYKVFYWDKEWVFVKKVKAINDKTLIIDGLPKNGLYLISGEGYHENLQRPFTFINGVLEYW
ncbi:hypothetical protein [Wocania ichthyoenteri]|uniref:hypothetical protein n=1 Tax=Wocania ichthyoenteri TaxID=1230531 RepID=UPI00053DDCEF|nr:hypothetical protein [Wocania ichthyoenteri]